MKLGFGLYRHQLDSDHFNFARQCGATHLVVHYTDYFKQGDQSGNARGDQPTGDALGWGIAGDPDQVWTREELVCLREKVEQHGLQLYALENFDPAFWSDVLLDGPNRARQMAGLKQLISDIGAAGIPVMGYYFSLAGVYGRQKGKWARGGAVSVGLDGYIDETPLPRGMVWNMRLSDSLGTEPVGQITHDELWRRFTAFMQELLPVAIDAGVRLAAHPDDPPLPTVRGTPRLVYQPTMYDRLLDIAPNHNNALEYCLGTLTEMTDRGDDCENIYAAVDRHSRRDAIAYIRVRNVKGVVPHYKEAFIDEGDLNIPRVLSILHQNNFQGVLIPDHTPLPNCPAPWHAGMAYAMGYMKSLMDQLQRGLRISQA